VEGDEPGEASELAEEYCDSFESIREIRIRKEDFDHGGTRDLGFQEAETQLVLCMTQDAVPKNRFLIENLVRCFEDDTVAAAYGRQLAVKRSDPLEKFSRSFNYPDSSAVKSKEDLPVLGIKTFFCSDVCAMWRKDRYEEMGGFEKRCIFNEDMILAGKLVQGGYRIAYCAEAMVWHSHRLSGMKQLRRNFDLGVSQAEHPEIFSAASSAKEGVKLVRENAAWLIQTGQWEELPGLLWISFMKAAGHVLGKNYRRLSRETVLRLTDNPGYWKKK